MKRVIKDKANKTLHLVNNNPQKANDKIGMLIDTILRDSHKTYKYILVTALLAKSANKEIDILSLQAKDKSDGAYDARSLCHNVVVPFERKVYPNSLGGSNEPYLNKPASFPRLSLDNAVRHGHDSKILTDLISLLSQIDSKDKAKKYLSSALYSMRCISKEIEEKYAIPDLNANAYSVSVYLYSKGNVLM